ncbi:Protein of unknown function (DUF2029) [Terriglobus roseus DSM 18391]|uniref:DUF2029 domain-containing protein n=1 Tax=Terriglobus roseus (strain DSM 18391 / NRRL B-41598 / KBS 63) TaxID=926566 RepID=I3ZG07_TERRK|nr:glycosyltransferase family 87 protein [Terriglobus roseus]AFL88175.1 Protein of unknown function (DUF2029) [Terriglobus roseus DSM 18391]
MHKRAAQNHLDGTSPRKERALLLTVGNCKPIQAFLLVLISLWVLTAVVGLLEHFALHWPKEHWSPMFVSTAPYDDFTIYRERFHYFHQADFFVPWQTHAVGISNFPFTYPAPAAIAFKLLFVFGSASEYVLFAFFLAGSLLALALFGRALTVHGFTGPSTICFLGLAAGLSYPAMFAIDRGNIELLNALLVWSAVACIWKRWWTAGAVLLGVAISFKLFPIFLLGLFVANRKYLATLVSVSSAGVATVLSYLALGPTLGEARRGIASGLLFFQQQYVLSFHQYEAEFDHSLFLPVKMVAIALHHFFPASLPAGLASYASGYLAIATLLCLVLFFWRIVKMPLPNQIIILVVLSVLVPPLSSDYTLVHLYAGWAVLTLCVVSSNRLDDRAMKGGLLAMALFGALMAPESFLYAHHFGFSGLAKMLMLLTLAATAAIFPWQYSGLLKDDGVALLT